MSDEDKQKKIAHFFNKYELEETKKGEFTRYINLIEKRPKILEVYEATIGQMLSDKIFAKENSSADNFLKDLDSLSENPKHHSANINVIADYAIANLSKTGEKTLLEVDSRIKHGISGLDKVKENKLASLLKMDARIQKARAEEKQSKPSQAEEKQSKPSQAEERQSKSPSPLNANSDFYKFMMNQDSSKLAKIFSESKDDKLGKLSKLKPDHIIENAPKELLDKIIEVSNKMNQREQSNGVVLFIKDSIASIVDFFCNLLKTKEIPGFGSALNDLAKCAEREVAKSSDEKNAPVKTFVDKLGLKKPESFKDKTQQKSSQEGSKAR